VIFSSLAGLLEKEDYMYKIEIQNSCSQNWDKMTETEKGKFCQNCSKEVIDFTYKTDDQIIKFLKKSNDSFCGRFHHSQTQRQLRKSKNKGRFLKPILASSFLFGSSTALANAQDFASRVKVIKKEIINEQVDDSTHKVEELTKELIISGRVVDENDEPMENVFVKNYKLQAKTKTDKYGNFELKIIDTSNLRKSELKIYHSGFKSEIIELKSLSNFENIKIKLRKLKYCSNRGVQVMGLVPVQRKTRWWEFWNWF
jgi:hypothetical protein